MFSPEVQAPFFGSQVIYSGQIAVNRAELEGLACAAFFFFLFNSVTKTRNDGYVKVRKEEVRMGEGRGGGV